MPLKRPPFTLVLAVLIAVLAVALVLLGHRSSAKRPVVGVGAAHACGRATAEAQVTAHSSVIITATAETPVVVIEEAVGPKGVATVSRSALETARVRATRPVAVTRRVLAAARACANGDSFTAARDQALRAAHAGAVTRAHADAARSAGPALRALMRAVYPTVFAEARAKAAARANDLARAERVRLAAQARARAAQEAGG